MTTNRQTGSHKVSPRVTIWKSRGPRPLPEWARYENLLFLYAKIVDNRYYLSRKNFLKINPYALKDKFLCFHGGFPKIKQSVNCFMKKFDIQYHSLNRVLMWISVTMEQVATYRNILIIKPSALGDIVHALPALASLRASFPQAKISWLVRPAFAPLFDCVSGIDELLLFDRKLLGNWWYRPFAFRALLSFLKELRQKHFDLVLDLQGLFRTAFFAYQSGCPRRYGMSIAREGAGMFYTQKVKPLTDTFHLIDYYNRIVTQAGGKILRTDSKITPSVSATTSLRSKLAAGGLTDKPYAVLIPGSAHQSKCWPTRRFAAIAEKISDEFNLSVVGAGIASEKILVEQLRQNTSVPILNLAGQTTIPELAALLKQARLVISNDTGPGHLAQALKTPTVLIFGHTNPLRVGPYHKPENVAAVEPTHRGPAIESSNPAYTITQVSEQLVWDKCLLVMSQSAEIQ
jgi:heptosyltransferase-1